MRAQRNPNYLSCWSAGILVAVLDTTTKELWWFAELDAERRQEAHGLPKYDINRKMVLTA